MIECKNANCLQPGGGRRAGTRDVSSHGKKGAYASDESNLGGHMLSLNIRLMKYEIVCFCP